ncbi:MAG: hypothetical protein DMG57_23830 [Acidobacteria bacterium]|nr:MAG: hypothetical protein DMG57_23830 [Acidobacteriota bacterium]
MKTDLGQPIDVGKLRGFVFLHDHGAPEAEAALMRLVWGDRANQSAIRPRPSFSTTLVFHQWDSADLRTSGLSRF